MSDSDSDTYTDYLKSRQAALQKKRPTVKCDESDSDDDFCGVQPIVKKRREVVQLVEEEEEEQESFVEPGTHDQHLKNKMDEMEEREFCEITLILPKSICSVYRKQLFSKAEYMINSKSTDNVLTKSLKMCDNMDGDEEEKDVEEVSEADTSACKTVIPATIEVLDCEISKDGRQRHEVPLNASFFEVRKALAATWKCGLDEVVLTYLGNTITAQATPRTLGIRPLQIPLPVIEAFKKEAVAPREVFTIENSPDYITLKVQLQNRKKPVHVQARPMMTILQIKQRLLEALIEEKEANIPTLEQMKVMFDDEYINDDDETCESLGLEEADCLDIYV